MALVIPWFDRVAVQFPKTRFPVGVSYSPPKHNFALFAVFVVIFRKVCCYSMRVVLFDPNSYYSRIQWKETAACFLS